MKKPERNDKSIKAAGGQSSYSTAILWYAGCLSARAPQLSAVSNSKAGVRVSERGRDRCFVFLIPGVSCLNAGQHLLKLCDYFFNVSGFARALLFRGVTFRCC